MCREPHLTIHSDAADVGYGRTLGFREGQGLRGLEEGRCFWSAADRVYSITFRKFRAVRLLLHRNFASYASIPGVQLLLLREEKWSKCATRLCWHPNR